MAHMRFSTKRLQIDKANATMLTAIIIASFISAFSLVAARALLSQRGYQSRVIAEKEKAKSQLKNNIKAVDALVAAYQQFTGTTENILKGNPSGTGDKDGDNAKIVLDALPSKYDFPALTTSLEKMINNSGYQIENITGTDDEVNQQAAEESPNPQPVEIPFQIAVRGAYGSMQQLTDNLQRSIRPFHIQKLEFSGSDSEMQLAITAKTYYVPEKGLNITTKEVK